MQNPPAYTLSVIIPLHGVEGYAARCARSLFRQTLHEGVEFIFVDDASPDGSVAEVESVLGDYPWRRAHTHIVSHESCRGLAAARRTGFSISRGAYIMVCDGDDWLEPDACEAMLGAITQNGVRMAVCGFVEELPGGARIERIPDQPVSTRRYIDSLLRGTSHNALWLRIVERTLYEQVGFAPEGLDYWEDVAVAAPLTQAAGRVAFLPRPLYHYDRTRRSALTLTRGRVHARSARRAAELLKQWAASLPPDAKPAAGAMRALELRTRLAEARMKRNPLWVVYRLLLLAANGSLFTSSMRRRR